MAGNPTAPNSPCLSLKASILRPNPGIMGIGFGKSSPNGPTIQVSELLLFTQIHGIWLNDKIPKEDVIANIPWISNLHSIHIPVMFHWISDGRSIPQRYLRLMFYYVSLYQDYSPKYNIIKLWWFTQIDGTFIPWFIRLQPSFCCFNPKKWRSTLW